MLIPRYSILRLLAITTVAAVFALIAGLGFRGATWAQALMIAVVGMGIVLLMQAVLFGIIAFVSVVLRRNTTQRPGVSPTVKLPLLIAALCLWPTGDVLAATSWKLSLPDATVKPTSGFRVTLDSTWVSAPGYRPVKVTVTAIAPSPADRTVTVQIGTGDYSRPSMSAIAERDIEVPTGTLSVTETIALPQFNDWQRTALSIWVDGRYAAELSQPDAHLGSYYNYYTDYDFSSQIKVLAIGADNETLRTAAIIATDVSTSNPYQNQWMYSSSQSAKPITDIRQILLRSDSETAAIAEADNLATSSPDLVKLLPGALPTRWIDYSCVDVVVVSVGDFEQLTTNQPAAWEAIRQWIAVGGNLWVLDAGDEWQGLPVVEKALQLPATENTPNADDPANRGWLSPPKNDVEAVIKELITDPIVAEEEGIIERFAPPDETEPEAPPPTPVKLLRREYQLGEVIVFAADRPFHGDTYLPIQVADPARLQWTARHGLVPDSGVHDFWNFLVPGVGLAPVTGFRILISVFVIAIGPVNYFVLRKWNRLNLLLVTVPASAALITALLFGYAILSDGLDTRVRVRSFTHIDQPTGTTATWARQSYYAGLAPRDGLHLSPDTVALPLSPGAARNGYNSVSRSSGTRRIDWNTDEHLSEGWLAARTPTQYVTLRAHQTSRQLRVTPDEDGLKVENQLGCHVRRLIVRTGDAIFGGQDLAPGARTVLRPDVSFHSLPEFRRALSDAEPQFPPEMINNNQGGFFRRRYYGSGSEIGATQRTSRLEVALNGRLIADDADSFGPYFGPHTYFAIVDRSPEVETGLGDAAREEGSFHVIFGRW